MKTDIIINETLFLRNCKIKEGGFGTSWEINPDPVLSELLRKEIILIDVDLRSDYYNGKAWVFPDSKSGNIIIDLCERDFEVSRRRYIRKAVLIVVALYLGAILLIGVFS